MKLNFIQDIASPHNNVICKALNEDSEIELNLWYCQNQAEMYGWKEDLTNAIKPAKMYKYKNIDLTFLWYCLTHRKEKYLIVGWQNINTKLLLIIFCLLRMKYSVWFDCPNDSTKRSLPKKIARSFFYSILKLSKSHVFGVGNVTLDYFKGRMFNADRLTNLPIFVDVSKAPETYKNHKQHILNKYSVDKDDLFLSAGSRLVYDKGFDILIDAISMLPSEIRNKLKCVIVGKGEEKERLISLIYSHDLQKNVFLEDWMDIDDYRSLAACSHMFIHCARFDAYGGGTLNAMAAGCAVIGTYQSGSAPDRIVDNKSGFLYNAEDYSKLVEIITWCFENKASCDEMGKNAYAIADKWKPEQGVNILKGNLL